jgi:hypothetical protein
LKIKRRGFVLVLNHRFETGLQAQSYRTAGFSAEGHAMTTHFSSMPLPAESTLDITIRVTQPLNVTSFSARQRVTQYVMHELSTQLGGDTPELTVGERVYWSVPIVFTLPGKGVLGRVGILRIDAATGELLTDPQTEQEITHHADQLAQRAALPAGA